MGDIIWYIIIFIGVLLNVIPLFFGKNENFGE